MPPPGVFGHAAQQEVVHVRARDADDVQVALCRHQLVEEVLVNVAGQGLPGVPVVLAMFLAVEHPHAGVALHLRPAKLLERLADGHEPLYGRLDEAVHRLAQSHSGPFWHLQRGRELLHG
eukprot:596243-Lingulodinium_polyedra.AAC.1